MKYICLCLFCRWFCLCFLNISLSLSKWRGWVLSSADLNEILQKSTAECISALFCFHKQPNHVDQTGGDVDDDNDDGEKHDIDDDKDDINYGKKNTFRLIFTFINGLVKIMVMNMMMLTTKIITKKVTKLMHLGFDFDFTKIVIILTRKQTKECSKQNGFTWKLFRVMNLCKTKIFYVNDID